MAPFFALAANTPRNFSEFVNLIIGLISLLIPLVVTLTLLVFFWGIIKAWIIGAGDPKEIENGKKIAVAGIVAFVLTASIWGIVSLLRYSFFGS